MSTGTPMVADHLVALINAAIVPGTSVRVFQGWPQLQQITKDLAAGTISINVWPRPETRNTSRYAVDWVPDDIPEPTMFVDIAGTVVTLSGTLYDAVQAFVMHVNGKAYALACHGLSLADIALGMATLINADTATTSSGATISIPGAFNVSANWTVAVPMTRELRRERRRFQIRIWAPDPDSRNAAADAADLALAENWHLTFPDGTHGEMLYTGSLQDDGEQLRGCYIRDLFYEVEYPTVQVGTAYTISTIAVSTSAGATFDAQGPAVTRIYD